MREETRHEIKSITDDLNKLSARVDGRVPRDISSTKQQHDTLHKEMNTELSVAKQDLIAFMQDLNKNNQEVRDSFCHSELAEEHKCASLDRDVAELREQIWCSQQYKSAT